MNSVTFPRRLSPITEEENGDHALSDYDDDTVPTDDQKINPLEPTNNSAINTPEEADLSYNSNSNTISKASESKSDSSSRNPTNTTSNLSYVQKQIYFNENLSDQTTIVEEKMPQFEVGQTVTNVSFNLPGKLPALEEASKDNALESEAKVANAKHCSTGDLISLLMCSGKGIIMTHPTNSGEPFSCPSRKKERETPDRVTEESLIRIGKVCQFGNDAVFVNPSRKRPLDFIDNLSSKGELCPVLNKMPCTITDATTPGELLKESEKESDDWGSGSSTECEEVSNIHSISSADDVKENGSGTITLERENEIGEKLIRRSELTQCNPTYYEQVEFSQNVDSVLVGLNNSGESNSWKNNLEKGIFCCGPENNVAFQRHTRHLFLNKISDEANNFIREIAEKVAEILKYQKSGADKRSDDLEPPAKTVGVKMDATKASVRGVYVSSFKVSKNSETVQDDGSSSSESNTDKRATQQEPNKAKLKPKKKKLKTSVKGVHKEPFIYTKFKALPDSTTHVIINQKDPNKCNDVSLESKSATVCKSCKSADSTKLILKRIRSSFDLCGWSAPSESQDILLCSTETLHPFASKGRMKGNVHDSSSDRSGQKGIVKGPVIANKMDRKKQKKEQNSTRRLAKKGRMTGNISLERDKRKSKDAIFKLQNIYGYGERCSNQTLRGQPSFNTFLKTKAIQSSETVKASQSTKTLSNLCTSSSESLKYFSLRDHCRQKLQHYEVIESTYIRSRLNEICDNNLKNDRSDICMDTQSLSDLQRASRKYLHDKLTKQQGSQSNDQITLPHVTNICNPWPPVYTPVCGLYVNSDFNESTSPVESMNDDSIKNFHLISGKGFNSTQQNATSKPSKNQNEFLPRITNSIANTPLPSKEGREQLKLPPVHIRGGKNETSDLILMRKQPFLSVKSLKANMTNEKKELNIKLQPLDTYQEEAVNNRRYPSNGCIKMKSKLVRMNIHLSPLTPRNNNNDDLIVTAKSFQKLDVIQPHDRKIGSAHSEPKHQCAVKQIYSTKDIKSHHYIKRRQSPKWHQYANDQVLYLSKAPLSDTHGVVEHLEDEDVGLTIRGLCPSLNSIQNEHEMKSNEMSQMGRSSALNIPLERTKKFNNRQARWPFSRFLSKTSNNSIDEK
ncbi:hypothetical protein CHS0354_003204 [Potamilus streckersoni]|uniref:Uncharacterized protein n=1 Tax=Potamilus streckersoni TaxID=2493646 RepID=A0AAE0VWQ3_9BIVA|nr:hypothetical protein CHS0354_003204 [Potamilus streckersoni]